MDIVTANLTALTIASLSAHALGPPVLPGLPCASIIDCRSNNKFFSFTDCQCHCIDFDECKRCRDPYVWSEEICNCECREKKPCTGGSYWNDESCQCECIKKRECCDYKYFDEEACDCVCNTIECCKSPNQLFWSPQLCRCLSARILHNSPSYYDHILNSP